MDPQEDEKKEGRDEKKRFALQERIPLQNAYEILKQVEHDNHGLILFFNPHSANPKFHYRLVTNTLKPIWESFSAVLRADSLVSNWPTLTR